MPAVSTSPAARARAGGTSCSRARKCRRSVFRSRSSVARVSLPEARPVAQAGTPLAAWAGPGAIPASRTAVASRARRRARGMRANLSGGGGSPETLGASARNGDDGREMVALPRTEHAVARSLAETADPRGATGRALRTIGERLGWLLGAVWEAAPDRPEALRCVETWRAEGVDAAERSEERRVGKECRCWWAPHHEQKKQKMTNGVRDHWRRSNATARRTDLGSLA